MLGIFVIVMLLAQAVSEMGAARKTLERIFREEGGYVLRLLRRFGVGPGDVDDVAQEVFLQVHRKLDQYDPARPLRPWLYAFAFRYAANYRRLGRHRGQPLGEESLREESGRTPETEVLAAEQRALLMRLLDELEFKQRAVLVMHDLEEIQVKEIAKILETPATTIYSRLHSARSKLAQLAEHATADGHELRHKQGELR